MSKAFDGAVAWVTGAGSGIGRACALELAAQGAVVCASGRREAPLAEVVRAIVEAGGTALAVRCDVTREDEVEKAVRVIVERFGRLDVAIANAGFGVGGRIEKLEVEDWRRQFETNVFGVVATARHALPELRKTAGRFAIIGSVSAFLTMPRGGPYSASKAAVRMIGETLSLELEGSGVSCTTVHPGFVESDIARTDNLGNFRADLEDRRPKRLMWSADRAARVIVSAIRKRKREVVFTGHGKVAVAVARHAPGVVRAAMTLANRRARRSRRVAG